jgi:hypothetical protein
MKTLLSLGFASMLCVALVFSDSPANARTLEGELVVTTPPNHFRIVGQSGSYVGPTSVVALDGHTVRVETSQNGKVTQITEIPVPINPVVHGESSVRGQLVVTDAATRRFSFAGDSQTYVAPPAIDVGSYAGRMVEITLDENGQVTAFRPVPGAGTSFNQPVAVPPCSYDGQGYSAGAVVCQSGTQFRCDGFQWQDLGSPCGAKGAMTGPSSPRSCVVGGASVASGSGVCRDGTTFRCTDGTWISTQTACR